MLACYRGDGDDGIHLLGPLAKKVIRIAPPLVITEAEARGVDGADAPAAGRRCPPGSASRPSCTGRRPLTPLPFRCLPRSGYYAAPPHSQSEDPQDGQGNRWRAQAPPTC